MQTENQRKYNEYVEEVKEAVERATEKRVMVQKVTKNNGVVLDGLSILTEEMNVAPTIYLNDFYEEYLSEGAVAVAKRIIAVYEENKPSESVDFSFFTDMEKVRPNIKMKLINYEKNKALLENVPHVRFLDLAIVFYYDCSSESFGNAAILIRNEYLHMWGVTMEQVYLAAVDNTPKNNPYEIKAIEEVMKELYMKELRKEMEKNRVTYSEQWLEEMAIQKLKESEPEGIETPMYVLTNTEKCNGATCVLYEQLLENFAKQVNDNLFIVPSSVHEMIMIPASHAGKVSKLREMVKEINATQINPEEVLSNNIYVYDGNTITIAE